MIGRATPDDYTVCKHIVKRYDVSKITDNYVAFRCSQSMRVDCTKDNERSRVCAKCEAQREDSFDSITTALLEEQVPRSREHVKACRKDAAMLYSRMVLPESWFKLAQHRPGAFADMTTWLHFQDLAGGKSIAAAMKDGFAHHKHARTNVPSEGLWYLEQGDGDQE